MIITIILLLLFLLLLLLLLLHLLLFPFSHLFTERQSFGSMNVSTFVW